MEPTTFTTNQLSQEDRDFVYRYVSQVDDYENYFINYPEYKSFCDLLIRLAFLKANNYIIFDELLLSNGISARYPKIQDGIEFDAWLYEELNDEGGLCLPETYSKYGLQALEPILEKY